MSDEAEETSSAIETAEPTETFDVDLVVPKEPTLDDILSRVERTTWRPDISKLASAVVDGVFTVPVGGKVLVEYLTNPWRDTTLWTVRKVYNTVESLVETTCELGHVALYDPVKTHAGCTNYLSKKVVLKVPDKSRKWTQYEEETLQELAKQSRRKKLVQDEEINETKTPSQALLRADGKKKRGRPAGAKNLTAEERVAKKKKKNET